MGNDCTSMCINDEGNRSLQPQVKPISPAQPVMDTNTITANTKGNSFQNHDFKPTEQSKITKNADNVFSLLT